MVGRARVFALGAVVAGLACAPTESSSDEGSDTSSDAGTDTGGPTGELAACKPAPPVEGCASITSLDVDACAVLDTGLIVHADAGQLVASTLCEDASLTAPTHLPDGFDCRLLAHDPAAAKLWWIGATAGAAILHQLDLASGLEDWQRALSYPGWDLVLIHDLVAADGGVYLAGSLHSEAGGESLAVLERVDPNAGGATIWAELGAPGHGFSASDDGQPLDGIHGLFPLAGGLGWVGARYGIDSAAWTVANADPETGATLWSASVVHDDYAHVVAVDGRGDTVVQTVGEWSWLAGGGEATMQTRATTPLGAPRWQHDALTWPGMTRPMLRLQVLDHRVVHVAVEATDPELGSGPARAWIHDLDGADRCTVELPELAAAEELRTWALRGGSVVIEVVRAGVAETVLLRPS